MSQDNARRHFLKLGSAGAALAGVAALASMPAATETAYAQAAADSVLRRVLDRGKLIVGTGSTNAPWHFENDKGDLVGMDIAMAKILAKGLFDDDSKVEFVQEDPAQRIPNLTTGKVDIVIQFMTISSARAQLINFSRPYYVEGVALLTRPDAPNKSFDALLKGGPDTKVAILQNVDAEAGVHQGAAASAGAAGRYPGQRRPGRSSRNAPTRLRSTSRPFAGWSPGTRAATPMPARAGRTSFTVPGSDRAISTG